MKRLDFSKFTEEELRESLGSIDREKFADNYRRLESEILRRGYTVSAFMEKQDKAIMEESDRRSGIEAGYMDGSGKYVPNQVSLASRLYNITVSVCLVSYGIYGMVRNDLYLPGKHGNGIHLHNVSAILCLMAFLLFGASMVSIIVDHYDKRNNEKKYFQFRSKTSILAIVFLVIAVLKEVVAGK